MDRNFCRAAHQAVVNASLSARRAWIEIETIAKANGKEKVALRKESVDRNVVLEKTGTSRTGRSPQGERG